jgi:hypothetical protein
MQGAFAVVAAAALCSAAVQAQTDVALSGFRTITSSSSGHGTQQTPANSEGGLIEVRHIVKPLVGFEFADSLHVANEVYSPESGACGTVCGQSTVSISGKANEFAFNWVATIKKGSVRPFALGGIGLITTLPGSSVLANRTVVRPAFIYGAGVDWSFAKHLGVRVQFRGNMTKAPDLSTAYPSTTAYTQIYEPMGGVFYRF